MNQTALQTREDNQAVVPSDVNAAALQSALNGDLAKLTGEDRLKFYGKLCEFTGLNPLSKPFDWISFQGKLTLYPNKGCAEQLRKLHGVTFDDAFERRLEFGVLIMTVRGTDRAGRRDFATAALPFDDKMPAADKAVAIMKLETKAKRRLTLSIAGLTMFARDADDLEPEARPEVQTTMPETASDRAAMLNAAIEKPIDVETISGEQTRTDRPAVGLKSPATTVDEASGASDKQRIGSVSPATGAEQSAPANLSQLTAPAPVPAPAKVETQPAPQASSSATTQTTTAAAVPSGFAGPDGLLTDDTVRNIEIILSEKDIKQGIRYLIAKSKLKQHEGKFDLARMDHQAANFILKKPQRFHQMVEDWVKSGGDRVPAP